MSKPGPGVDPLKPAGERKLIKQAFGRYRIQRELGSGTMGDVYLAEDVRLGRLVALKIPKKASLEEPEVLARFYREAKTMAALRHNNICPVYDVGAIDGTHYLTMAYIPGKPISSYLSKDKVPAAKQTALLIRKIAIALDEAHQRGVVHRDLKPSNVMLDDRGEPIVMDFGLARLMNDAENAQLTQSGVILGTPAYMSPEQVSGDTARIGPKTDIYALGVMMYQLLTGALPFTGPTMLVLSQIAAQPPKKPSQLKPDVDPILEAICLKMMAKEIGDRYAGMKDVIAALTEYLKTCVVPGRENASAEQTALSRTGRPPWLWPVIGGLGVALSFFLVMMTRHTWGVQNHLAIEQRGDRADSSLPGEAGPSRDSEEKPSENSPELAVAPFDAVQAKAYQHAWSKHLGLPVEWSNSLGMKFLLIPPGEALTGSSPEEIDKLLEAPEMQGSSWAVDLLKSEIPQRRVAFTQPYYLGETEVTVGQFREFINQTGYRTVAEQTGGGISFEVGFKDFEQRPEFVWSNARYALAENYPVRFLTLQDAQSFVEWLGKQCGGSYSVPTEAQWEYACRAGTSTLWYFESEMAEKFEWLGRTGVQPVGEKLGNPFGLRDLLGNVQELAVDRNQNAIVRGGTEASPLTFARSASRSVPWGPPGFLVGLRVAISGDLEAAVQGRQTPTDSGKEFANPPETPGNSAGSDGNGG